MFGVELFIPFTVRVWRELYLCFFPFGFEGRVWDLIILVPDHCLSFNFFVMKQVYELWCIYNLLLNMAYRCNPNISEFSVDRLSFSYIWLFPPN